MDTNKRIRTTDFTDEKFELRHSFVIRHSDFVILLIRLSDFVIPLIRVIGVIRG
jgi:hypothetical protein